MLNLAAWSIGISILLYFVAAVMVLRLIRSDGIRSQWMVMLVIFGLFCIRRIVQLQAYLGRASLTPAELFSEIITVIISILLLVVVQLMTGVYREAASARKSREQVVAKSVQLQTLHEIGLELARQTDTDVLMGSIMQRAIDLMQGSGGVIYAYRPDLDVLELHLGVGTGLPPPGAHLRRGEGLSGKVWISRQTLFINNYHTWDGRYKAYDPYRLGAILAAPVMWGDDLLGVVNILGHPGHSFSEDDARLLEQFALQAAIALHNAMELEKTRSRSHHHQLLNEIARATLEQADTFSMLETLANRLGELFGADECYMSLWDEANHRAIPAAAFGSMRSSYPGMQVLAGETSITEVVLNLGRPLLIENADTSPLISQKIVERFPVRAGIGIPMMTAHEKLGSAIVGYYLPRTFSDDEVELAQEASQILSLALLKVRLLETVRSSAQELEQRVVERTAELNAANQKLEDAARRLKEVNAELESFTYTVSHDLRAPLRALQGYATALNEDYAHSLGVDGQDYARRMVETARRMDRQILDLLEYSLLTRREITLDPVDAGAALDGALLRLEAEIEARGARVEVERPLPCLLAHRATLEQVLANLVGNGLIYVEKGVAPCIRVRATPAPDVAGWRVWVDDNGIGIATSHHEQIFKVFERLHGVEAYPGTGIGLAIVHKGVTRMGGRVGVESEPGQGSSFWIELQAAAEAPAG